MNATLHGLGQSLWLDNITHALLRSGTLGRYIEELAAVTGLTSNPTIFDHAIKDGEHYDDAIRRRALAGCLWQDRDPADIGNIVRLPSGTATAWEKRHARPTPDQPCLRCRRGEGARFRLNRRSRLLLLPPRTLTSLQPPKSQRVGASFGEVR